LNDKGEPPSHLKIVGVQATGGVIAGAVTSCVTTPIDTIKTRLQVLFSNWIYTSYFFFVKNASLQQIVLSVVATMLCNCAILCSLL
jgi:hypothetical protein